MMCRRGLDRMLVLDGGGTSALVRLEVGGRGGLVRVLRRFLERMQLELDYTQCRCVRYLERGILDNNYSA
jgi:hypothetical protein